MNRLSSKSVLLGIALCLLLIIVQPPVSWSAAYPEKPITLICPFGAGSGSDLINRIVMPYIKAALGKEIIVDYKDGGGGVLGSNYFMTLKADGYSLLSYNQPPVEFQSQFIKTAYNSENLIPLLTLDWRPEIIIVKATSPFKTLKNLVDYAKQNPNKLTMGNTGTFTSNHLTYALFSKATGTKLVRVPFDSGAKMNVALLGDQIDVTASNKKWLTVHEGKLRCLGSMWSERTEPDIPTFKEQGYDVSNWAAGMIYVKKGTPEPIVNYLREKLAPLAKDEKLKKEIIDAGIDYGVYDWKKSEQLTAQIIKMVRENKELIAQSAK